jgi:single-stranded-DNA-specific exonuclease
MQMPVSKNWEIAVPIPPDAREPLKTYPLILQQLLFNRAVRSEEEAVRFLSDIGSMHDPFLLSGMEVTVNRIIEAIKRHELIAVYGDYDVDGITGTVLLVQVLTRMGATISGYIPNRFEEGYGLNNSALESLYRDGVRLVITVDCGIRSVREASFARKLGLPPVRSYSSKPGQHFLIRKINASNYLQVRKAIIKRRLIKKGLDLIITDHHEPGSHLPNSYSVVNPKLAGDQYPDKFLAGVGVAYKIAQALIQKRQDAGISRDDWLDLVAIGTVSDIVPMVGENRALVRAGLKRLKETRNQGLYSLVLSAGINIHRINSKDIGFRIGPRLNAAGRLKSAMAAYDLLQTEDVKIAGNLAQALENQNRERQDLTRKMQTQAEELEVGAGSPDILFAVHPDFGWDSAGLVGLVASRLTETYYRPAIVGCHDHEKTRASCRSIPEFHITKALDECESLLEKHGGHAMAAGFTIRNENIFALKQKLLEIAERELKGRDLRPVIRADMEISLKELRGVVNILDNLEPTGSQNPEAVFVSRNVRVKSFRAVGKEAKHLSLVLTDGIADFRAIAFNQGYWLSQMPAYVDVIYTYERNEFQGVETMQINVLDIKSAAPQGFSYKIRAN